MVLEQFWCQLRSKDFEFAKKYNLEIIKVVSSEAQNIMILKKHM